ncbi:MAG: hypothetical protein M1820_004334 [Bogoriella megaspora]|nr:MAG: hypothetical protein M1820_004334 [Bogoriella megaspora]
MNVIIVGGSLSGLMGGIVLKHAGHNVRIIEKDSDERQSHMAGVCLGYDAQKFLALHDRMSQPFSLHSEQLQLLNQSAKPTLFVKVPRNATSWDTLYYRLRANFDGYRSSYFLEPPQNAPQDGNAAYSSRQQVIGIDRDNDCEKMTLKVEDRMSEETYSIDADMVIGADGPNSFIRSTYLPECKHHFVGYIAWRGIVSEENISASTREVFSKNVTIYMYGRQHCLVYTIPGRRGSLCIGERYLNFCWYTNETQDSLNNIMVDATTGHRYHNTVPAGCVRANVWLSQLQLAEEAPLPSPFLEVIRNIRQPFIQIIHDHNVPRTVFEGGKILLIGDEVTLFRPHTAFSASQAAYHALQLEGFLAGRISKSDLEENMLRYGYLHALQSFSFGEFYQGTMITAAIVAMKYHAVRVTDKLACWWRGTESLLRTTERFEAKTSG